MSGSNTTNGHAAALLAPEGAWRPSPFAGDAAAGDAPDPGLEPVPVVSGRCVVAAHRLEQTERADLDPATYLPSECCRDGSDCEPGAVAAADGDRWPVLVLGSPTARWTEPRGPVDASEIGALAGAAVATAAGLGCRTLLAPWCVDRGTGAQLHAALAARGAVVQRRAFAHAIDVGRGGIEGLVRSLPRPVQQRRHREASAVQAGAFRVVRLTPEDWARRRPAAVRLAAALDAGGTVAPDHAGPPPPPEADDEQPVWAALHGDELRAFAAFRRDRDTLWLAARGLAREARGFPAALHFHLLLHEVPAAAARLGVTRVEYGTSSAGAWTLRGCVPTPVYSAVMAIGETA